MIVHEMSMQLYAGEARPATDVAVELTYSGADPLAVLIVMTTAMQTGVTWRMGRDLLAEGLDDKAGSGDVMVWPVDDSILIHLAGLFDGERHECTLLADAQDIHRFIVAAHREVAPGEEEVDIDGMIAGLFAASAE